MGYSFVINPRLSIWLQTLKVNHLMKQLWPRKITVKLYNLLCNSNIFLIYVFLISAKETVVGQ